MNSQNEIDAKLERIGAHIYKSFQFGLISFDVCEAALESLNTCTDTLILGIPEPQNDIYMTQDEFERAIEAEQEIQRTNSPKSQAWQGAHARMYKLVEQFTGKPPKDAWGR
jgi:hypothetical protein